MRKISAPKRTRRRLSRGIAIAAVAALGAGLAACTPAGGNTGGGGGGSGDKTFTIYWHPAHVYKAYTKVIKEFGKEHHLKINWQKYQWPDMQTKLIAGFKSGNVPDLTEESSAGLGIQFGVNGNVMALNKYIAKDGKKMGFPDDFQKAAVDARTYEGKIYSIPMHLTVNGVLFYNKTMFKDAGIAHPPTTWDEFLTDAKKLTHDNVYGFAANSDSSYAGPWYVQAGAKFSDVAKDEFLTPDSNGDKAMQFLQDLVYKYKVSPPPVASTDYTGPQKLMSAGRAAMIVSGPWEIVPLKASKIDWGIAPPLKGVKQAATLAGAGLMIPSKAKHPKLAWELIQKLTSLKVELAVTKETGVTMPRKSWAKSPEITKDPTLAPIAKALGVVVAKDPALSASGKGGQVNQLFKTAYQQIVIQHKPVQDALGSFRTQAKALIK